MVQTVREYLREKGKLKEEKELQDAFVLGVPGAGKSAYVLDEIKRELLNASDYKWVRILPDNEYEDCIDAIWCHKDEVDKRPVKVDDKVEYRRFNPYKYPGSSSTGTVIAIFEGIGPVDIGEIYLANQD